MTCSVLHGDESSASVLSPGRCARYQEFAEGNTLFPAFFSCLSRRFSFMLFFGAFTSFFGDLSPIAETLLPNDWQCSDESSVFGTVLKSADVGVHLPHLSFAELRSAQCKYDSVCCFGRFMYFKEPVQARDLECVSNRMVCGKYQPQTPGLRCQYHDDSN